MTYKPAVLEMSSDDRDLQAKLSNAFASKNLELFKLALTRGADAGFVDPKTHLSIFNVICRKPGSAQFIRLCIEDGHCDVNQQNEYNMKRPIHFCVESKDIGNLTELLNYNPDVDAQFETKTPIYLLCKDLTNDNVSKIFDCIKMLLKHGCNVNIADRASVTPILLLGYSNVFGVEEIIKYMLDNTVVDLDRFRNGEARNTLVAKYPDMALPGKIEGLVDFHYLKGLLKEHKEELFVKTLQSFIDNGALDTASKMDMLHKDYGDGNLLQIATQEGLLLALKVLVPNVENAMIAKPNINSPLVIACLSGNCEILQYLLKELDIDRKQDEPLLTFVIKEFGCVSKGHQCDFNKCFKILLADNRININKTDSLNCTALHYAVLNKNEGAIKALLQKGAYIGIKNIFQDFPISNINPSILEEYFDSCIKTNGLRPNDKKYEIIFDYSSLVPDQVRLDDEDAGLDDKPMSYIIGRCAQEMVPIEYMAKTPELKRLIKHPLISSFLWLKWNRLGFIFYTNFVAYSIFCISMILYLVFCYGHDVLNPIETGLFVLYCLGVIYVTMRELIQMFMLSIGYFKLLENYLEMVLIGISYTVLLVRDISNDEFRRALAAVAILLAATEFSILVGSLPITSISVHMVILKTVLFTFMQSFGLYSIFIISFALSFFILLGPKVDSDSGKFDSPWTSIIKTIVMFTGEYDADNIVFNGNPVIYTVFIVFVFFISIVLLNLLNGLAVNDTTLIRSEAELTAFIYRAKLLTRYEKAMFGIPKGPNSFFHRVHKWVVKKFTANRVSIFPSYLPSNKLIVMPNVQYQLYVSRKLDEIIEIGENETTVRQTTRSDQNVPLLSLCNLCCLFGKRWAKMDDQILKSARQVLDSEIRPHEEKEEEKEVNRRLDQCEKSIESILSAINRGTSQNLDV